jgi:hypothetical protein
MKNQMKEKKRRKWKWKKNSEKWEYLRGISLEQR